MEKIKVGKRVVAIEFTDDGIVAQCDGFECEMEGHGADSIVAATRNVVSHSVKAEQDAIEKQRALEDARRILGG